MTSPSEHTENMSSDNRLPGMPERYLGRAQRRNNVSRLEFLTMDGLEAAQAQDMDAAVLTATEPSIETQIAHMELQLRQQQQQMAEQIETVQRQTRIKARQEWEEELEERVAIECNRITGLCEEFARQCKQYFADVETEVVKLALAIAARVLHRETNLDPLLLTAAVRVVLQKVADNSTMQLRVPLADVEKWRAAMAADAESRVQFIGDERLGAGECVVETSVGTVELGVKAQLEEIEKGFFDLLQQRPA